MDRLLYWIRRQLDAAALREQKRVHDERTALEAQAYLARVRREEIENAAAEERRVALNARLSPESVALIEVMKESAVKNFKRGGEPYSWACANPAI